MSPDPSLGVKQR